MGLQESKIATEKKEGSTNFRFNITAYAMVIALAVIWIMFQFLTKGTFLSVRNLSNLFRQMSITGILAIGMVMCIISGNFDLSVGSVVGITGALAAVAQTHWDLAPYLSVLIVILVGVVIGLWQGFWIAYRNVPAFIVTLGGMMIFRGMTLWVTKGNAIPISNEGFIFIGQHYLPKLLGYLLAVVSIVAYLYLDIRNKKTRISYGFDVPSAIRSLLNYAVATVLIGVFIVIMNLYQGVPITVIILLSLFMLFSFILSNTQFGRYIYAIGGNINAAKISGINTKRITLLVFTLMSVLASISGLILAARLAAATPTAGNMYEMDAIASCVIGGVSLKGGRGTVFGAIVGALVMASLNNGMSLMNIASSIQYMVNGLVLLMAVWFDISTNVGE